MEKTSSALAVARGGRSQSELAKRLGVTQATVSNWETGESAPPLKAWKRIARVYGVKIADLLAHFAGAPS
jgi:transcriptional regulator with XRE-family HTH domain